MREFLLKQVVEEEAKVAALDYERYKRYVQARRDAGIPVRRYVTEEQKSRHRENQRRYNRRHPGIRSLMSRIYRLNNAERINASRALYRSTHRDLLKAQKAKHRAKMTQQQKAAVNEGKRRWYKSEKGKMTRQRANFKRRGLNPHPFILNNRFGGAVLHHLTSDVGIYIPEELHNSVPHNLKTFQGMVDLNEAVAAWMNEKEAALQGSNSWATSSPLPLHFSEEEA